MRMNRFLLVLSGVSTLTLAGCAADTMTNERLKDAQYWQRANATSATYLDGKKAQQMLQRDIAHCVTDVRELERLGMIRPAIPGNRLKDGQIPDRTTPKGSMAQWESPTRDGYLYSEFYDYHDFETCMISKGWERTQYLPYDQAETSRKDYMEAVVGQRYRTKVQERRPEVVKQDEQQNDFSAVNQ